MDSIFLLLNFFAYSPSLNHSLAYTLAFWKLGERHHCYRSKLPTLLILPGGGSSDRDLEMNVLRRPGIRFTGLLGVLSVKEVKPPFVVIFYKAITMNLPSTPHHHHHLL